MLFTEITKIYFSQEKNKVLKKKINPMIETYRISAVTDSARIVSLIYLNNKNQTILCFKIA